MYFFSGWKCEALDLEESMHEKNSLKVNAYREDVWAGERWYGEGGKYHLHREVFLGLMILQLIEKSVVDGENEGRAL